MFSITQGRWAALGRFRCTVRGCWRSPEEKGSWRFLAAWMKSSAGLPWVQVQLSHEGFPHDQLPDDCLHRLSTLSPLPRNSCSGWAQLADQLTHFKPDTVYCCAPAHIARQAARLCWQHGVPAQRIWLRTDQVAPQAERWRSALEGPVQRYDRVLAMLNRPPPPG